MNLKKTFLHLKPTKNCAWHSVRGVTEKTVERSVRDGLPEMNQTQITKGVMVEALVDGQFAYSATQDLSLAGLQKALEQACVQAEAAAQHAVFRFDLAVRPKVSGEYRSPQVKSLDLFSVQDLMDHLKLCSQALRTGSEIISTVAAARMVQSEHEFYSSNGSAITQNFSLITQDLAATAQRHNVVQTRTDAGFRGRSYQMGAEIFDAIKDVERAKKIGDEARELVYAEICPTGNADLVLAPDQMMLQIHESIGHPLEYDRILGDEKNFAGLSFIKPNDFGHLQYGSPLLNVVFDPTVANEFASYAFDDGGARAVRAHLIQNGILQRGLGGLESQARLGLAGVANFRASAWQRAPIDRMANINLEAGTSSFAEILADVTFGVFMTSNVCWSIDDYRNKFQFGCEYGKLIENGKLTKTVRNPNYRGVTVPFWNRLRKVGNAETYEIYGTPYCGKGEPNQIIRVGHASPVCLFSDIEIFGGLQ